MKKIEKKSADCNEAFRENMKKNKKGERYCKTKTIIKAEKELLNVNHRLTNIRRNYLHQTTTELINRKPRFLVMEDLNVKGMVKNRRLSKAIQQQCFREFRRQMEYKSEWNHISPTPLPGSRPLFSLFPPAGNENNRPCACAQGLFASYHLHNGRQGR